MVTETKKEEEKKDKGGNFNDLMSMFMAKEGIKEVSDDKFLNPTMKNTKVATDKKDSEKPAPVPPKEKQKVEGVNFNDLMSQYMTKEGLKVPSDDKYLNPLKHKSASANIKRPAPEELKAPAVPKGMGKT